MLGWHRFRLYRFLGIREQSYCRCPCPYCWKPVDESASVAFAAILKICSMHIWRLTRHRNTHTRSMNSYFAKINFVSVSTRRAADRGKKIKRLHSDNIFFYSRHSSTLVYSLVVSTGDAWTRFTCARCVSSYLFQCFLFGIPVSMKGNESHGSRYHYWPLGWWVTQIWFWNPKIVAYRFAVIRPRRLCCH